MSEASKDSNAVSPLFSMAMLPLNQLELFYQASRCAFACTSVSNDSSRNEVLSFIQSETETGFPYLSNISTCLIWDHCKVIVRRAITSTLIESRLCGKILATEDEKLNKKINTILSQHERPRISDVIELENLIDRLNTKGKKGVELFEYLLAYFGIAAMVSDEAKNVRRRDHQFASMQRIRNSSVHWMGEDHMGFDASQVVDKTETICSWQVDENNVTSFFDAARNYLSVVCNRVARTLDLTPPAALPIE